MGANFAVQCTIVRKAKIEGFYPSIICTSNDNGYLSITLVSDSNESIGEVSGVIRIDGFRQGTGLVNTIISVRTLLKTVKFRLVKVILYLLLILILIFRQHPHCLAFTFLSRHQYLLNLDNHNAMEKVAQYELVIFQKAPLLHQFD